MPTQWLSRLSARSPRAFTIASIPMVALAMWAAVPHAGSSAPPATSSNEQNRNTHEAIVTTYGRLPLAFEPNVGQTDARVRFLSRGNGYTLFLTDTGSVFALRPSSVPPPRAARSRERATPPATIRMTFAGAQPRAAMSALEPLPGVSHYAIGNDPGKWRSNVPHYAKVRQESVYPGIDVVYYGNPRQLEYDFVVAPGADPGLIALDVAGADRLDIDRDGHLVLRVGDQQVRLNKPFAYQDLGGRRLAVSADYVRRGLDGVRLEIGDYDHSQTLVIDPVLEYSTYLGGTGEDFAAGIAVDGAGNAYVVGTTGSTDFPTTVGVAQATFGGGEGVFGLPSDTFVTKINTAGSALVYSTYLGGAGDEFGSAIAVDSGGNAYVAGITFGVDQETNNFPATAGAFQEEYQGGNHDAFVTKLSPAGALAYSTYLGGACHDTAWGIAVDGSGNAYIAAQSQVGGPEPSDLCTQDFPITPGAFQTTHGTAGEDAIVAKLNATGSALVYATYLAGVTGGLPDDFARGIAVDSTGNAYVTGSTLAPDFPTTPGAYQTTHGGGSCGTLPDVKPCADVFLTKVNSTGTAPLLYSTFLGRASGDEGNAVAIDASGNAYLTGNTTSSDFPTTPGAYQTTHGAGSDAFVTKFNPTGSALVYSTLLGGTMGANGASQTGTGIALDASFNAYVVGHTRASNFPTTAGAVQPTYGGGTDTESFFCESGYCDAFLSKLNATGTQLLYSTYLGGSGNDSAGGVAVRSGSAYVAGGTASTNLLTTAGAHKTTLGGPTDAFITRLTLPGASFTDEPLVAGVTVVRAVHIAELRERVDAARAAHGLGAYSYTDPTLIVGSTIVRAVHLTDLRTALAQAYVAAMMTPPEYTDPGLAPGTIIRAVHITELRAAVVAIE